MYREGWLVAVLLALLVGCSRGGCDCAVEQRPRVGGGAHIQVRYDEGLDVEVSKIEGSSWVSPFYQDYPGTSGRTMRTFTIRMPNQFEEHVYDVEILDEEGELLVTCPVTLAYGHTTEVEVTCE